MTLATQEARILLTQHPPVADRLLVVVLEYLGWSVLDGRHDTLPAETTASGASAAAASLAAAHWIDRTIVA